MIILGIDPGLATVGYAVLKTIIPANKKQDRNEKPKVLDFGCITTSAAWTPGERLVKINKEILSLIEIHNPDIISVESLFFFKNVKTAMPVSQAKGVILFTAAKKNIAIVEFTPLQVKMTMTGHGRAEKSQVQAMTKQLLDLSAFDNKHKDRKKDDAADALGVALCAVLHHKHSL